MAGVGWAASGMVDSWEHPKRLMFFKQQEWHRCGDGIVPATSTASPSWSHSQPWKTYLIIHNISTYILAPIPFTQKTPYIGIVVFVCVGVGTWSCSLKCNKLQPKKTSLLKHSSFPS